MFCQYTRTIPIITFRIICQKLRCLQVMNSTLVYHMPRIFSYSTNIILQTLRNFIFPLAVNLTFSFFKPCLSFERPQQGTLSFKELVKAADCKLPLCCSLGGYYLHLKSTLLLKSDIPHAQSFFSFKCNLVLVYFRAPKEQ